MTSSAMPRVKRKSTAKGDGQNDTRRSAVGPRGGPKALMPFVRDALWQQAGRFKTKPIQVPTSHPYGYAVVV